MHILWEIYSKYIHKVHQKIPQTRLLWLYFKVIISICLPITWEIYLKYIFKIIFIHKHEVYVMFGSSGMVLNVDFWDVRELEPKFGF